MCKINIKKKKMRSDLHDLAAVTAGMLPVLLLHREAAGGALVDQGVLPGLHGPGQGLRLVYDGHLDGGEEAGVVLDSLKTIVFKTEKSSSQLKQLGGRSVLDLS